MNSRLSLFCILSLLVLLLSGCATMIRGASQEISIASNPSGASVKINGMPKGSTPVMIMLPRGDNQFVRIESPGYEPYEIVLENYFRPYALSNLLLFPFMPVGVIIDKVNRVDYTYTPSSINAVLMPLSRRDDVPPVQ
ncbi:MAG: PEGA domain-containing protein [Deltaproteobacteria bacterium]|jgi:hypothetical protein|nr:PEGA domain-containing protein [Deltaproteobacteria bacterium]